MIGRMGVSMLVVVMSGAVASAETAKVRDEVITGRDAIIFEHFERSALDLAEENGLSCETASRLLHDFAARNSRRVLVPSEWRYALLEGLYGLDVPFPAAHSFMAALAREVSLPVDTGFLKSVRTLDLASRVLPSLEPGIRAPVPLAQPSPRYTDAARAAGIEGTVRVRCVVLEDGTVANCRVVRSLGYGLDESVVLTLQNEWKFRPATRDGSPIALEANVEVSMRLY